MLRLSELTMLRFQPQTSAPVLPRRLYCPQRRSAPCRVHNSRRGDNGRSSLAPCDSGAPPLSGLLMRAARAAMAGALSLSLLLQPAFAEETMSIAFPASTDPAIRRAQQTMVEAWAYVDGLYLDPSLSHEDWSKMLQDSLAASFKASSAGEVHSLTQQLLASLGDPYTRLLQGDDAAALAAEEQGKIIASGLGLQQAAITAGTPSKGSEQQQQQRAGEVLQVSFVVEGSPAAAAGVKEGDVLLAVAGQPVQGQQLRDVYKLLSKETDVMLLRQQQSAALPAAAGSSSSSYRPPLLQLAPAEAAGSPAAAAAGQQAASPPAAAAAAPAGIPGSDAGSAYTVHLKPEALEFAPVQYGIIRPDSLLSDGSSNSSSSSGCSRSDTAVGSVGSSSGLPGIAYLKLLSFSATAPQEVAEALIDMQQLKTRAQLEQQQQLEEPQQQLEEPQQQLAGLILDLRDNVGGLVEAGVDISKDFLNAGQVLCIAADRMGVEETVTLPDAHRLTNLPLVLLVNHNTASTAELVAGALHDGLAAPLIGTTTYGKGKSQRVVQLDDGSSTLLVSTVRYFTPRHTQIDGVGLAPEAVCDPQEIGGERWAGGGQDDDALISLLDDPCIRLAAGKLQALAAQPL